MRLPPNIRPSSHLQHAPKTRPSARSTPTEAPIQFLRAQFPQIDAIKTYPKASKVIFKLMKQLEDELQQKEENEEKELTIIINKKCNPKNANRALSKLINLFKEKKPESISQFLKNPTIEKWLRNIQVNKTNPTYSSNLVLILRIIPAASLKAKKSTGQDSCEKTIKFCDEIAKRWLQQCDNSLKLSTTNQTTEMSNHTEVAPNTAYQDQDPNIPNKDVEATPYQEPRPTTPDTIWVDPNIPNKDVEATPYPEPPPTTPNQILFAVNPTEEPGIPLEKLKPPLDLDHPELVAEMKSLANAPPKPLTHAPL